jgi:hypothetical protein
MRRGEVERGTDGSVRSLTRGWDPRLRAATALALAVVAVATAITYQRKIEDGKTAFVRWRPQILALVAGEDVYAPSHERPPYPNPPVMGLLLYPLAVLPVEVGVWLLFAIKVVLAALAVAFALDAVAPRGPPLPAPWAITGIALSLRPILSDLQHGNVNILVLFPVMAGLRALQRDRDVASGLWVALATAFKITPGLLLVYFAWKRWWRACLAFGAGLVAFTLLPGFAVGFGPLAGMLVAYHGEMLLPYAAEGSVLHTEESNQSLGAVLHRYLTDAPSIELDTGHVAFNPVSLDLDTAAWVVRAASIALLAALALVCRTPGSPRGLRIASEYGLVLIAMLAISPRTWKHHYVVMALPYLCVLAWAARPAWRSWQRRLVGAVIASQLLVLATSRDVAKLAWFVDDAHKWTQGLGAYLFSALVVMAALAALLVAARRGSAGGSAVAPEGVAGAGIPRVEAAPEPGRTLP